MTNPPPELPAKEPAPEAFGDQPKRNLTRRTVVHAAAWSVPAISLAVATPARAASRQTFTVRITIPDPQSRPVGADLSDLSATLLIDGQPAPAGHALLIVVNGSAAWSGSTDAGKTLITDASGRVRFTGLSATSTPGQVDISAISSEGGGASDLKSLTITAPVGRPAVITFSPDSYTATVGAAFAGITGTVSAPTTGPRPSQLSLAYTGGFTGPATVGVNGTSGTFLVSGVRAPAAETTGTIAASAPDTTGDTATLNATNAATLDLILFQATVQPGGVIEGVADYIRSSGSVASTLITFNVSGDASFSNGSKNANAATNAYGEATMPTLTATSTASGTITVTAYVGDNSFIRDTEDVTVSAPVAGTGPMVFTGSLGTWQPVSADLATVLPTTKSLAEAKAAAGVFSFDQVSKNQWTIRSQSGLYVQRGTPYYTLGTEPTVFTFGGTVNQILFPVDSDVLHAVVSDGRLYQVNSIKPGRFVSPTH